MLTLGSLFDGIGGWLLAAVHNGVKPIWSSEIEKFPMAVTKHHFPDVIQLGDITKLDGATLPPVDIICAGSPCQDLSVAGKREGLKGERSGLFRTAIDIVRRMRMHTGGRQPRFFVWENVPGAFSSNKGLDFRAVLEEIGQTEIPMPANDKWAENGVAQLPGCEIAWRVLDAQWWVPQRRKRIFLVADFGPGKPCAKEILLVEKSLRGNFEKGESERKEVAGSVTDGTGIPIVLRMRGGCDGGGKGALLSENKSLTLAANANDQTVFCIAGNTIDRKVENGGNGSGFQEKVSYTLNTMDRHAVAMSTTGGQIVYENHAQDYRLKETKVIPTLGVNPTRNPTLVTEIIPNVTMSTVGGQKCWTTSKASFMTNFTEEKAQTLVATDWKDAPVLVTGNEHTEFTDEIYTVASDERSSAFKKNVCDTLTHHDHFRSPVINAPVEESIVTEKTQYAVRRLTPTECERLQGLPDDYTLIDDKTCSDSARYKALGNGMAQPCADFVIRRIVEEVEKERTE